MLQIIHCHYYTICTVSLHIAVLSSPTRAILQNVVALIIIRCEHAHKILENTLISQHFNLAVLTLRKFAAFLFTNILAPSTSIPQVGL